jgi:hypothetical protein
MYLCTTGYSLHRVVRFSFTNKIDRHDITEILLKVVWNTLPLTKPHVRSLKLICEMNNKLGRSTENVDYICIYALRAIHYMWINACEDHSLYLNPFNICEWMYMRTILCESLYIRTLHYIFNLQKKKIH